MTLKIKLNRIILGLAAIMLMLSTNAVAIAQVGEPEGKLPVIGRRESFSEQRAPIDVPGGPGHLMFSAFDFQPRRMTTEWDYFEGKELYNPGDTQGNYFASVHLPDGATVNQVVIYYYDSQSTADITLYLDRMEAGNNIKQTMSEMATGDLFSYDYATDTSIDYSLIDLANYSYTLQLTIPGGKGSNLTMLQVRIDYDYPTFLPTVLK